MTRKICLISDLHLSTNPRLWKEANTLANAGYDVVIITVWTSAAKRMRDSELIKGNAIKYVAGVNLIAGEVNSARRFYYRLRHRLALELKRWFNYDSAWNLGYAPNRLVGKAMTEKADLYICHAEFGILIGKRLIEKGCTVAFDIEDWYSRDYLISTRPVKLLETLEAFALHHGIYCSCPSQSMATALHKQYGGNEPLVIYNGFSVQESGKLSPGKPNRSTSLIWFSQTIGPGRGLEILSEILQDLAIPVEVHLIGDCVAEYDKKYKSIFPFYKGHSLYFHGAVPHSQLSTEIRKYDIGLALELNQPDNKNTTVSNKILQYLQAGIKVLATDTLGQQEIARCFPQSVKLVSLANRTSWAKTLEELILKNSDSCSELEIFNSNFSWEAQERRLLNK